MTRLLVWTYFLTLLLVCSAEINFINDSSHEQPDPMENEDAFEGDIDGTSIDDRMGRNAVSGQSSLWPNGVITYQIDPSLESYKHLFKRAMKIIEEHTCIRFHSRKDYSRDDDYVLIYNGSGCRSHVGRKQGRQMLSMGDGCRVIGVVLHELMHAVGFFHMHSRSDRDQYLKVNWNHIRKGAEKNFIALRPARNKLFTKFDFDSVMMYGPRTFSSNSMPTLEAIVPNTRFFPSKYKHGLSSSDVESINKLYNCRSGERK